jgi:hypothetical protein
VQSPNTFSVRVRVRVKVRVKVRVSEAIDPVVPECKAPIHRLTTTLPHTGKPCAILGATFE